MGYYPEMDVSPELVPDAASYFQLITGTLRWIMELGNINKVMEVLLLLSHLALLREGNLEMAVHLMVHLKQK